MNKPFNEFFPTSIRGNNDVNAKAFGAVGNGIADDTAAIQEAINWAIDNNQHIVNLPGGTYKISDTIHISFGVVAGTANYHSIELRGVGAAGLSGPHFNGTKILCTFLDRPAVSMQGMLDGGVRGIAFEGPVPRADLQPQPLAIRSVASNYVPSGAQDNQWTPFCAVCVDPWYIAPPGGFPEYPEPTSYPALCGTVPTKYGGKAHSSQFYVEECSFAYFTVAVFIYGLVQAEFGRFRQNNIGYCKVGYALGNSQARNMDFSNNLIHFCHTCWDASSYTQGIGNLQGCYDNITTGYGYQLFNHTSGGWSGQVTGNNLLNEAGVIIGRFDGGTVIFNECNLNLVDASYHPTTNAITELW